MSISEPNAEAATIDTDVKDRISREPPFVMERMTKLKKADRSFDYAFWQRQSFTERINASWDLIRHYHLTVQGQDEDALRLQRSVETIQRKPR